MIPENATRTNSIPNIDEIDKAIRASVIIVNYNHRAYLEGCLKSLMEDRDPADEIILVDNASTDNSVEFVRETFPQVQIVCNSQNIGFAGGCNLGARIAQGEYLAFLNPDTIVTPGWLKKLIDAIRVNPKAGLATPKILLHDKPEQINTAGNNIHLAGLTMCRGLGLHRDSLVEPGAVSAISGAAFVIRKELFYELDGFDEDFFLYMEDTDLSWRARLAGYQCWYVPDSIITHDYAVRFGPLKVYYQERNRYIMLFKNLRWPSLVFLAPALFLMEIVSWGFVLLREPRRYQNKLKAYQWVKTNWSSILSKRRKVQAMRCESDRNILLDSSFRLDFEQVDEGNIGHLARLIFNPIFFLLKVFILIFVWW